MSQKYAVLGLLNIAPMTGYLIKKNLESSIKKFWPVSYGGLYPALHKLSDEGLIESHKKDDDGRGQITYEITKIGKETFKEWITSKTANIQYKDEFMLKVFLSKDLDDKETLEILEAYHRHKQEEVDNLQALIDLRTTAKVYVNRAMEFVVDYTLETFEKEIELIAQFIEELKTNINDPSKRGK